MNKYKILTNPLTKIIFNAAYKLGYFANKISLESTNEWEKYLENTYNFKARSYINEIKSNDCVNGSISIYERDKHDKFDEIVYEQKLDWDDVVSIKYNDYIFSIGDEIMDVTEHINRREKYTIKSFKLGHRGLPSPTKNNLNYTVDIYVNQKLEGYLNEIEFIKPYEEYVLPIPIGVTYLNEQIYEGDDLIVYNTKSGSSYPITAQKLDKRNSNGIYYPNNCIEEENWLIFKTKEDVKNYKESVKLKYSPADIKQFVEYLEHNFNKTGETISGKEVLKYFKM